MRKLWLFVIIFIFPFNIVATPTDFKLISDGKDIIGAIGLPSPYFGPSDQTAESDFLKDYVYPNLFKYNSSLSFGRDGVNRVFWVVLRPNIWIGNTNSFPNFWNASTNPSNIPSNYTGISFTLKFTNVDISAITTTYIPQKLTPCCTIGDYKYDKINLNEKSDWSDLLTITGNTVNVTLRTFLTADAFGIPYEVIKHPASVSFILNGDGIPKMKQIQFLPNSIILPNHVYLGHNRNISLPTGSTIPLTESVLIGGIPAGSPSAGIDFFKVIDGVISPTLGLATTIGVSSTSSTSAVFGTTILLTSYQLFGKKRKKAIASGKDKGGYNTMIKNALRINK